MKYNYDDLPVVEFDATTAALHAFTGEQAKRIAACLAEILPSDLYTIEFDNGHMGMHPVCVGATDKLLAGKYPGARSIAWFFDTTWTWDDEPNGLVRMFVNVETAADPAQVENDAYGQDGTHPFVSDNEVTIAKWIVEMVTTRELVI